MSKWADQPLLVRLPAPIKRALRLKAEEDGVSMNTLVIEALQDDLKVDLDENPREQGRPTRG